MKKEGKKILYLSDKTAWVAIGLGLSFWFVEAAIHSFILHEGTLIRHLFSPAAHEAWMRSAVTFIFIIFGVYAQLLFNARKKLEGELCQREQFLSGVFESIQDGISVLHPDLTIQYVNGVMKRWYDQNLPLSGKKCYEAYHNRGTSCESCPALRSLTSGQLEYNIVPGLPGSPVEYLELFTYPIKAPDSDRLTGVVEFVRDITMRKHAEEKLKKYQTGLEKLVKERTAELIATNEELQQELAERRQMEEELLQIKINLEEANQQLKQNQAQLVQSEKMASIGQLAAGVAHEINNPVGFINSNLTTLDEYRRDLTTLINNYLELEQLADRDPALSNNHDLAGALEAIRNLKEKMDLDFILGDFDKVISESREGADRIKKIVQDLKDFSHVDKADLNWADLNKGMESTLNIVWNELKYNAKVTKDYGDIPEVYCYPQQINQVVMNILVNAAHAIEDKGEIKISTAYIDGAEPMVEIRISDTGKGIPPENLPKIFDPFFTTKPVGKGTGLGLSMAYSIIKKHDGEIKVESEVGKGTTFVIELPVNGPRTKEGDTSDTG
ncbi:MAG: ATP-binding protein [Desulfovibrionales bacterium]|nr:ATP-binding protein [Desulfovibrionales bacterium]